MTKELIKTAVYKSIYGRLKLIAETIGIPEEIIINNWLMKGMSKDWKLFTDFMEEMEKNKIQGEELRENLDNFFKSLATYYFDTNENLKEQDFQENFVDEFFKFSTIAEDVEFRKQYFTNDKRKLKP